MEVIIQFLKDNWSLVISVVVLILSFILQLIKKKPVDDMVSLIDEWSIDAIELAESSSVKGEAKLTIAVQYVLGQIHKYFPKVDPGIYRQGVIDTIETILSTPQKKV